MARVLAAPYDKVASMAIESFPSIEVEIEPPSYSAVIRQDRQSVRNLNRTRRSNLDVPLAEKATTRPACCKHWLLILGVTFAVIFIIIGAQSIKAKHHKTETKLSQQAVQDGDSDFQVVADNQSMHTRSPQINDRERPV
ncbi:hypothetical protein BVRB_022320 [Beta vulgaris subsp. vulgaris]|uniref:Uncharacterized protein n=1 Tax=Beta vulgaris subsp. vulgaris TaxID=3555 RepID=A0A0J8B3C2_BETVV|nr:hypothetical protein BVRB_022320 [Beta vulgaris subsp. vulgaris]